MSFKVSLKHRVYTETLWIVMGNDYPVADGFETEAEAEAYCKLRMDEQKSKDPRLLGYATIFYRAFAISFHRTVELVDTNRRK